MFQGKPGLASDKIELDLSVELVGMVLQENQEKSSLNLRTAYIQQRSLELVESRI